MSAHRLRRIGNRGMRVDPTAVVAVITRTSPPRVAVVLEGGTALDVTLISRIEGRARDGFAAGKPVRVVDEATAEDVEKVWQQLTEARDVGPPRPGTKITGHGYH